MYSRHAIQMFRVLFRLIQVSKIEVIPYIYFPRHTAVLLDISGLDFVVRVQEANALPVQYRVPYSEPNVGVLGETICKDLPLLLSVNTVPSTTEYMSQANRPPC